MMKRFTSGHWLVLAILVVGVVVVSYPMYGGFRSGPSRVDDGLIRLHRLQVATSLYKDDHGAYPPMHDAASFKRPLSPDQIKDVTLFDDLATRKPFVPNPSLSGGRDLPKGADPDKLVLAYLTRPQEDRVLFVTLDGSTRQVPIKDWPTLKQQSNIP